MSARHKAAEKRFGRRARPTIDRRIAAAESRCWPRPAKNPRTSGSTPDDVGARGNFQRVVARPAHERVVSVRETTALQQLIARSRDEARRESATGAGVAGTKRIVARAALNCSVAEAGLDPVVALGDTDELIPSGITAP